MSLSDCVYTLYRQYALYTALEVDPATGPEGKVQGNQVVLDSEWTCCSKVEKEPTAGITSSENTAPLPRMIRWGVRGVTFGTL